MLSRLRISGRGGSGRLWRAFSTVGSKSTGHPASVCVVGAGPAGFYTAESLLRMANGRFNLKLSIVERLAVPFGLVRFGVAPDHPEVKYVENVFQGLLENPSVDFFGNVAVGRDVTVPELMQMYDAVVLACGAESNRDLGLPSEHLQNIFSARDFVGWYNAHPDFTNLPVDLSRITDAVVIGNGNVALDVARILMRNYEELAKTDISNHALSTLKRSMIRRVHVVGRRGLAQAAWTAKEVREILHAVSSVAPIVADENDLNVSSVDEQELQSNRSRRRCVHIMKDAYSKGRASEELAGRKELVFHFRRAPVEFLPDDHGNVMRADFLRTVLEGDAGRQRVVGLDDGDRLKLPAQLVVKSVGYKSVPLDGVPFDPKGSTVPNDRGKVAGEERLFVSGWLKRGPSGIIATNKWDAEETSSMAISHLSKVRDTSGTGLLGNVRLSELLRKRSVKAVALSGWNLIDAEERKRGSEQDRPRSKISSTEALLKHAASAEILPTAEENSEL
ncbi:hypothetical protein NDN08_005060 [Rhodosorus marinus]|uniref:NADPH:adrenodoxin oxidoreductase, mitochondrial n=1 Tax=Rhodosorus marinus TaxID=101924 RepID=A0AAV8V1H4_9RHOD|nr:hypothetical protein NDN08_005060 [Rhodosorus marinus]